jgi:hypothetical protein
MFFGTNAGLRTAAGILAVLASVFAAGCKSERQVEPPRAPAPQAPVTTPQEIPAPAKPTEAVLALKFAEKDTATYRVITESQRSIDWEGPVPEGRSFREGQTSVRTEVMFEQEILSVNDDGSALAKITIKHLKHLASRNSIVETEFDSSQGQDNLMAKLTGQSYTILISPSGEVLKVVDKEDITSTVQGSSPVHKRALRLISDDAIIRRHGTLTLDASGPLSVGEKFKSTRDFSFGLMGSKSYERVYTLKELKEVDGSEIATVEMDAVPSSKVSPSSEVEVSKMFDSNDTYTGSLVFDVTTGRIEDYSEKLQSEWIVADQIDQKKEVSQAEKEPTVLRMKSVRFYRIERIP